MLMCVFSPSVSLYNAVIGTRMHGTTTPPRNAGTYFNSIMFMVASSVVSTILILNYHHRNSDTHEMSEWVSKPSYTLCAKDFERVSRTTSASIYTTMNALASKRGVKGWWWWSQKPNKT